MKWSQTETKAVFVNLQQTWPKMRLNLREKADWAKAVQQYPYDIIMRAIGQHRSRQIETADRQRREADWLPSLPDLLDVCRQLAGVGFAESVQQREYRQWYYALTSIEQAAEQVRALNQAVSADRFESPLERDKARYALEWWSQRLQREQALQQISAAYAERMRVGGCAACATKELIGQPKNICSRCHFRKAN